MKESFELLRQHLTQHVATIRYALGVIAPLHDQPIGDASW